VVGVAVVVVVVVGASVVVVVVVGGIQLFPQDVIPCVRVKPIAAYASI
jgi:hypothetical protein